jgi:hypothetical protein
MKFLTNQFTQSLLKKKKRREKKKKKKGEEKMEDTGFRRKEETKSPSLLSRNTRNKLEKASREGEFF